MPAHHFRELDTFYNFWLQRKFNINLLNCILKQRYNLKSETKEEPQPIQLYLLVKTEVLASLYYKVNSVIFLVRTTTGHAQAVCLQKVYAPY